MQENLLSAPGSPGIEPKWTSSAKTGLGTSISSDSRVWFTISHGILNEIYYPKIDRVCTRDFGFLISDGKEYFSEEKRDTTCKLTFIKDNIPAYKMINTAKDENYSIEKIIITDPERDVVLQKIIFRALKNNPDGFNLYALIAPHIGNKGYENNAWLGEYKGVPMLFAQRGSTVLAVCCSQKWLKRSVGYVGFSDGWQDVNKNKRMTWEYQTALNGNVAMTGEIDIKSCNGEFTIATGFGQSPEAAALHALNSIRSDFNEILKSYIKCWENWFKGLKIDREKSCSNNRAKFSAAVLKMHEDKMFRGGIIASLSIPWGNTKSDDDLGGYHLVWTRDLAESAGGLLASGSNEFINILNYLRGVQESDGHWPQNMWLDGGTFWKGIQMDEAAFPILLLEQAYKNNFLKKDDLKFYHDMFLNAVSFIIKNGPVTQQDRWEEDSGYSPFTLAVEIAALISAAFIFEKLEDIVSANYLYALADYWNDCIEKWCYVEGTDISKKIGVNGYYVRIAPEDSSESSSPISGYVAIKNKTLDQSKQIASNIVSVDALALVRFGLRDANDQKILNTIKVIDKFLKTDTPYGPVWHRYNNDGYGEHEDGREFDGTGIGRGWPLLTGERAHYELAAGNIEKAKELLKTLESFAGDSGLLPEQVWDSEDIPEKSLFIGKPTGGAMPLAWAHAEHLKLVRSINDNNIFDMPDGTFNRYVKKKTENKYCCWRLNNKFKMMSYGKILRIELPEQAIVQWTIDNWKHTNETQTSGTIFGINYIDIDSNGIQKNVIISFRVFWLNTNTTDGNNFEVSFEN